MVVEARRQIEALTEGRLTSLGVAAVTIDIVTGLSGCWVPVMTPFLNVLRVLTIAVFGVNLFRDLVARYGHRPPDVLLRVAAVTLGLFAVYVGFRAAIVVQACRL